MFTVYTKDDCIWCVRAKELFKSKNIYFIEKKLSVDFNASEFFKKFPGRKTLPLILENENVIGGFTELEKIFSII